MGVLFRKKPLPDLLEDTIGESFASFGIPTSDEAFDEIKFAWEGEHGCSEYLKKWKLERKKTLPVKDLKPSEWFQTKYSEWQKTVEDLKKRQKDFKREQEEKQYQDNKKKKEDARKEAEKDKEKAKENEKPKADEKKD